MSRNNFRAIAPSPGLGGSKSSSPLQILQRWSRPATGIRTRRASASHCAPWREDGGPGDGAGRQRRAGTTRAQEFLPPMAGEEVEGTERALSPAAPTWSQDPGPIPSKGTDADVQLGPIADKGTDAEQATKRCRATYEPVSVGVLQCNLCGKRVKGDRWALRAHQLTSSRCMYHQGHASKAREPCVHCGTPLAAGDAWARHQHARHCRRQQAGRSRPPDRATSQTRRAAGSRRANSPPLQQWTAAQWREWTSAQTEEAPQTSPHIEVCAGIGRHPTG